MKRILVIGAQGTIGGALVSNLKECSKVSSLSQENCDYRPESLDQAAEHIAQDGMVQQIYCCIGVLHNQDLSPEKRLAHLEPETLAEYFRINSILPALCIKHFSPLLDKSQHSQFVVLSAMVGSIGDYKLGGWYGYRSSKAALNMLVKTASVELGRTNKKASIVVVHPGTTKGGLSKPFAASVSKDKYYTPEQSAQRIIAIANSLRPEQSGQFFNWDGSTLEW